MSSTSLQESREGLSAHDSGDFLSENLGRFVKELSMPRENKDYDFALAYCHKLVDLSFMIKDLSSSDARSLVDSMIVRHYSAGSYILVESQDVEYYSIILEGYIGLYRSSHRGECTELIRPCFRGSHFSDIDILTETSSSVAALTKISSYVLHIPKESFNAYLAEKCLQSVLNIQKFVSYGGNIETDAFKFIYHSIEKQVYKPEEMIIDEGENTEFVYFLLHGQCKVSCRQEKQPRELVNTTASSIISEDEEFLWTYKDVCRIIRKGACLNDEGVLNEKALPYSINAGSSEVSVFRVHVSVFDRYLPNSTRASMVLKAFEKEELREGQVAQARRVRGNTRRSSVGPLGISIDDAEDDSPKFKRSNVTLSSIEELESGTLASSAEKIRQMKRGKAKSFLVLLNKGLALRFGMTALQVVPYEIAAFQTHAIKICPKNPLPQRLLRVNVDSHHSEESPRKGVDNSHLRLDFLRSTFLSRLREATIHAQFDQERVCVFVIEKRRITTSLVVQLTEIVTTRDGACIKNKPDEKLLLPTSEGSLRRPIEASPPSPEEKGENSTHKDNKEFL